MPDGQTIGLFGAVLAFVCGFFLVRSTRVTSPDPAAWVVYGLIAGIVLWFGGFCFGPDPCEGLVDRERADASPATYSTVGKPNRAASRDDEGVAVVLRVL